MDMKNFWNKIKPSKRKIMQLYFALLFNSNLQGFFTGKIYANHDPSSTTKQFCAPGINCYSCPGAVGACPLGSLQGSFSADRSTLFYVCGTLLLYAILFGRMICGWFCPFGLIQELLYKIKSPKVGKSPVSRILSYFKYVVLVFFVGVIPITYAFRNQPLPAFCKYICPAGTIEGGLLLLSNEANESVFFPMLNYLFTWKFMLMISIVVACVFIFRMFCRFICPLGALYGLFNKFSLFGVKVEESKCTHCNLCVANCKCDIRHVSDQECIACGECIDVCPTKAISWKGSKIFLKHNELPHSAQDMPAPDPSALAKFVRSSRLLLCAEGILGLIYGLLLLPLSVLGAIGLAFSASLTIPKLALLALFMLPLMIGGVMLCCGIHATACGIKAKRDLRPAAEYSRRMELFALYLLCGNLPMLALHIINNVRISKRAAILHAAINSQEVSNQTTKTSGNQTPGKLLTRIVAILVMATVLIGAIAYNWDPSVKLFPSSGTTDPTDPTQELVVGSEVGNLCPSDNLNVITPEAVTDEKIDPTKTGKITIINFWGTWCSACVAELPYFDRIATEYADQVEVIAVHTSSLLPTAPGYIAGNYADSNITFVADYAGEGNYDAFYSALGGAESGGAYPYTVILDENGVILFKTFAAMHYETLLEQVQTALGGAEKPSVGYEVGNLCPSDNLNVITSEAVTEESLDPTKTGKITIINFWGTWCSACVAELPYFDRIATEYADQVEVIAVHTSSLLPTAPGYIAGNYADSNITFVADYAGEGNYDAFYSALGGAESGGAYPYTVILDENGVILFKTFAAMHYETLLEQVEKALNG